MTEGSDGTLRSFVRDRPAQSTRVVAVPGGGERAVVCAGAVPGVSWVCAGSGAVRRVERSRRRAGGRTAEVKR